MADGKPPVSVRILLLVVTLGVAGWVGYHRIVARGPAPIFEAIQSADPTLVDAAVEMVNAADLTDPATGLLDAQRRLWCGTVKGRSDGSVAVVARRGYGNSPAVVEELALGWGSGLTDRQRWLLSECRRVRR